MAGNEIDSGVDYEFFYVEETAFGVLETSPTFIKVGIVNGGSIKFKNEVIKHKGIGTDHVIASSHSKQESSGSVKMESTDAVVEFLKTLHENPDKSYTLLFKASGNSTRWAYSLGNRLSSISYDVKDGEAIKVEVGVEGAGFDTATADPFTTPTYGTWTNSASYIWSDTSVTKGANWAVPGAINEVSGFSFKASWGVKKKWHLNQGNLPARVQQTGYEADGSMTLDLENGEQYDAIVDQEGGDLTIPISTTYTVTLTNAKFKDGEFPVDEMALIEYKMGFDYEELTIA